MRVLGLCDHLTQVASIWNGLKKIKNTRLYFLVCNNSKNKSSFSFFREQISWLSRQRFNTIFTIVKLLISKKLILSPKPLLDKTYWLSKKKFDIGLHSMGVIYRKKTIDLFKIGILNPHIGKLPEYRGRSVMEWSILEGNQTGITCFLIDEGIDTGNSILFFKKINVSRFEKIADAKKHLFEQNVEMFYKAVKQIKKGPQYIKNNLSLGRRYYVMSKLMSDVVEKTLKNLG